MKLLKIQHFTVDRCLPRTYATRIHAALLDGNAACTRCARTERSISFDGVRAIAHAGPWRLDGWAARPVDTTPGVFDDGSHHSFDVWGVYGSRVITLSRQSVGLDVYYLGLARDAAQFEQGTAKETRHTFGARVWHQGVWAYDAEAMFQAGRFGSGDIRASRFVIEG